MQKNFHVVLISIGAMFTALAFSQRNREVINNHLVHTDYPIIGPVYLSPHPVVVELPNFIMATPGHFFIAKLPIKVTRTWLTPLSENTYCAVCKKDLLFSMLWGSTITPPKKDFTVDIVTT